MNEEFFTADYHDDAELVVVGIPFDGTSSFRPGSRFGPPAIRNYLYGIEGWSPYQNRDMAYYSIYDYGDIEIPFGNTEKTLDIIGDTLNPLFDADKKVISLGGEHLVTYGIIRSLVNYYDNLTIIHFDAHADMRDEYMGEKLSHATVIRRAGEITGFENVYQFGIRSGTKEEWDFSKNYCNFYPFNLDKFFEVIETFSEDDPLYVTIDLDVLDPAYFPGTGTPEPAGISTKELLKAILALNYKNVVGADIVELSPDYDRSGASSMAASHVLRELSLAML